MQFITGLWNKFVTRRNISYLFINIGNIPIMTLISSFLAVYYVNVLGMDEYAVGTMFLIARIFDGINDPIIGGIIDKAGGEKLTKFKRILVIGTLICSLNFLVLWIGPMVVPISVKLVLAYVSYLLLGITFPIMDISLNSLLPVLTDDKEERDTLSSIKVIGYGIGTVLIEIVVPIILSVFGSTQTTYLFIIVAFVVMVLLFSIGGAVSLKKQPPSIEAGQSKEKNLNGIQAFIKTFRERNVWSTFLSGICFYTGNAALAVSNTYYTTYYLGDVKYLVYVTVATYSLEMFVVFLLPWFSKKIGKKGLFSMGLFVAGIGLLIRFIPIQNEMACLVALLVSSAIFGVGYGFVMILFYSIQADNVDCVFQSTGVESEGTIAALMSMVNKFGKGIGGAVPLYVLGIMKLSDGTYSRLSLRIIDGLLPAILFLIGGFVFYLNYEEKNYKERI